MRPTAIIVVLVGLYATICAAAPMEPVRQASDLSWIRSKTTLYAIDRSGLVAIALDTGKSTVLVPGVRLAGGTLLLSPNKTQIFFGSQDTGYRLFDVRTHQQLDLADVLPSESVVQLSPDWSRLAWINPQSARVGVIDLPSLKRFEFVLPTGLPEQNTVINSIDWSYDGRQILVDSVSSAIARRIVTDSLSMEPEASLGYDPAGPSVTEATLLASMKEQYWAVNPDNGMVESITAVLKPNSSDNAPYPKQSLHFFKNGKDIGTDFSFVCEICDRWLPLRAVFFRNGARISTDEFGGIYLSQANGNVSLIQAPLPSSLTLPPASRNPTNLFVVFDDDYLLYYFDHQFWIYGVRENTKAPFPVGLSNRFQF